MIEIIRAARFIIPATELTFLFLHMYLYLKAETKLAAVVGFQNLLVMAASLKTLYQVELVGYIFQAHTSTSSCSGARGLQRSVCLKSYNVQKRVITFTLGLNTAKNTHYMKKASGKVVRNWLSYKKVNVRVCLSPPVVELGAPRINMLVWGPASPAFGGVCCLFISRCSTVFWIRHFFQRSKLLGNIPTIYKLPGQLFKFLTFSKLYKFSKPVDTTDVPIRQRLLANIYEGCPKSLASYFFKNRKMMLERYRAVVI